MRPHPWCWPLALVFAVHWADAAEEWSLIWSDEFSQSTVNSSKWLFEEGNGCSFNICGWGNAEKQLYQQESATVAESALQITASVAIVQGMQRFYSSRMRSALARRAPARVAARVKVPSVYGLWPAVWMLPSNIYPAPWPQTGEIDILEQDGSTPNVSVHSLHYEGSNYEAKWHGYTSEVATVDPIGEFHVYSVEYSDNYITMSIDDTVPQAPSIAALGWLRPSVY